jgi:hypothetical protein
MKSTMSRTRGLRGKRVGRRVADGKVADTGPFWAPQPVRRAVKAGQLVQDASYKRAPDCPTQQ